MKPHRYSTRASAQRRRVRQALERLLLACLDAPPPPGGGAPAPLQQGKQALARRLGRSVSAVNRWHREGMLPAVLVPRALRLARERGLDLAAADLAPDMYDD